MARIATKFIAANAVTNAKMAQMVTGTIKGNNSGSTGNPLDLTSTQVTAMLNPFVGDSGTGGTQGLVPAPPAGSNAAFEFLSAGGIWTTVELDAYEIASTTTSTIASATAAQLGSMTETPVSGTYLVIYSTTLTSNSSTGVITISIHSAGTQIASTVRTVQPEFGTVLGATTALPFPVTLNCITTVNGSQAIQVFWSMSNGTATATNGNFDLVKIR